MSFEDPVNIEDLTFIDRSNSPVLARAAKGNTPVNHGKTFHPGGDESLNCLLPLGRTGHLGRKVMYYQLLTAQDESCRNAMLLAGSASGLRETI
jgi:hypothetical protein